MQERGFFFTSKTFAQTPDRDTVSCRCFPVHAPLHTFCFFRNHANLSQKGFRRGHRTLTTKVAIAPPVSRRIFIPGDYVCREGSNQPEAWCPFARARWSWRSQALKFVKSAMVRRLWRIRTMEVELTRVHRKSNGWTTCDFEPLPLQLLSTFRVPQVRTKSNNERLKSAP